MQKMKENHAKSLLRENNEVKKHRLEALFEKNPSLVESKKIKF